VPPTIKNKQHHDLRTILIAKDTLVNMEPKGTVLPIVQITDFGGGGNQCSMEYVFVTSDMGTQ